MSDKDKDSEKLWKDFDKAREEAYLHCCNLLRRMKEEGTTEVPFCSYSGESSFLELKFCLQCGKEL